MNVPNRDDILFHWGNFTRNTRGCILVGSYFSEDGMAVMDSKIAFQAFMESLSSVKEFELFIDLWQSTTTKIDEK